MHKINLPTIGNLEMRELVPIIDKDILKINIQYETDKFHKMSVKAIKLSTLEEVGTLYYNDEDFQPGKMSSLKIL